MQIRIDAQLNVRVRWDKAAGVYVSYAPALDIYSQGATPEGAVRAIEGAMRMYLITALEQDKIGRVLKRFGEVVASGMGPEPRQYINVVQDGGVQITAKAVPLETVQV
jgi:predicted RNase H-like HicB family nuclease